MKTQKYKVFVHGKNFLLEWEAEGQGKKIEKAGFYVTVFVEADDLKAVEMAAVELLRRDESLKGTKNKKTDPPMLHVEEIQEVEASEEKSNHRTGFVFYTGDEQIDTDT